MDPASSDIDVNLDGLELPSPEARKLRAAPGGPASLPAICMFGRYEILGRLAFGGMAEIFLARESSAQAGAARHVVIKRVLPNVAGDEQFVEMFLNEV
jgi:serine/threonine-protein kinase